MPDKYFRMMTNQLQNKINEWRKNHVIEEKDLFRFLHNLKGTAGTIGLKNIYHESEEKENLFEEKSKNQLRESDWMPHLSDLQKALEKDKPEAESKLVNDQELLTDNDLSEDESVPFILVIDPDIAFVTKVKDDLESNGFQVGIAFTIEKGMALLDDLNPEMLIVDFSFLVMDDLLVCTDLMEKAAAGTIPIVVVSDNPTDENQEIAYKLGAHDFIKKTINEKVFLSFINNRISFLKRIQSKIALDELTGAYNRNYIERELYKMHSRLKKNLIERYTVAMISIDHLEKINEQHGHLVGEDVSRKFVETFVQVKNKHDFIGRYRGEFACVFPGKSEKQAMEKIDQCQKQFSEISMTSASVSFNNTFSAGVVEVNNAFEHQKKLIDKAEKALAYSKNNGGNQIAGYEEKLADVPTKDEVTLIIVDDDRMVREMLIHHFSRRKTISGRPIELKTYSDGLSFVEDDWYEPDKQYAILLDGIMPKMDGIEALQNVRRKYGEKNIIISMLTGRKGEAEVARALKIGADDYMLKPFNVKEVAVRLDRLFERLSRA